MNDHERICTKLPLAAAGVLASGEILTVEQHAMTCPTCRRELEILRLYSRGLKELPHPIVPDGLLQRTRARVARENAAAAGQRRHGRMLVLLALFSWALGAVFWVLVRALTDGVWTILGTNLASAATWSVVSALLVWTTAGVAVVMLRARNELVRRVL